MFMWEFTSGVPPFNDRVHDLQLVKPSALEVKDIIKNWIFLSKYIKVEDTNEELKSNIMEFINAPIGRDNLETESHPQACYTSRLHSNFTSEFE
ncbi:hypothetical protein RclHR1_09400008 [Rhizophagus clarus]|uniref:Serine-threonine/tyrosine-protein kinase catalytic domain-containing protein n=1 Tax=Rhizophagus clarus TaxID=94130 RepID=A0A2Z6S4M5_9GLOM|nr:hypothetical protein RclHR1_09400008 [Rhizophagus clarus]